MIAVAYSCDNRFRVEAVVNAATQTISHLYAHTNSITLTAREGYYPYQLSEFNALASQHMVINIDNIGLRRDNLRHLNMKN